MYPEDFDDIVVENKHGFAKYEVHVQVAICVHQLEAQVNNGGFEQYFYNSSGMFALETILALRTIGALKTASLLEAAILIGYPTGYPADSSFHQKLLANSDESMEKLGELDNEFYSYSDDLSGLVNAYLRINT